MYKFNEVTKRLEPTEALCQYCETEQSTNMEDNYFVSLYAVKGRTNIIVYSSVKFSELPVGIPRCSACHIIHEGASLKGNLMGWTLAVAFVIFVFVVGGAWGFLAILAGIFIGVFGSRAIERKLVRDKRIYTRMEGAKQNEVVQELVISGWSFTAPMA